MKSFKKNEIQKNYNKNKYRRVRVILKIYLFKHYFASFFPNSYAKTLFAKKLF